MSPLLVMFPSTLPSFCRTMPSSPTGVSAEPMKPLLFISPVTVAPLSMSTPSSPAAMLPALAMLPMLIPPAVL